MAYVFISYCRDNEAIAKALAEDIGDSGHRVWLDQQLSGGHAWWEQILAVIRETDVFVFALAPQSLESEACKREYRYAAALGKAVLPVLVADGVSVNLLPPELSRIQHVDYRRQDKRGAIALLRSLNGLPKSAPLPEPLPEPPPPPLSYLGSLMEQIDAPNELTFAQQAALVIQLKERASGIQDREEVRTLLSRLRKRHDLYARIADEIDDLLAETTRHSVPPAASAHTAAFGTPAERGFAPKPEARETEPATRGADPATSQLHAAPRPSRWRSVLRGLLAVLFGYVFAGLTMMALFESGLLNRSARGEAVMLLWGVWIVALWFLLPHVGRSMRQRFARQKKA